MLSKISRFVVCLIFALAVLPFCAIGRDDVPPLDYTLGSGDTITIAVYDEPDLSVEAKLNESGTLSYPFIGKIKVVGLTVGELQNAIADGLRGDYLIDPKVRVNVLEYRPFYITGEVKEPGGYPYQAGLTIEKAVSLAAGFTERANKKSILVQSEKSSDRKPRKVSLNSQVRPGDIITIEESFF